MASNDVKRVTLYFEGGLCKSHFEGDWTGRDVYVAMRQLEKGYRAYQAERRKASQGNTAVENAKEDAQWSETGSTSSGSQVTPTTQTSLSSLKATLSSQRLLQAKK